MSQLVLWTQSVPRKYPPHTITPPPPAWTVEDKAGWSMLSCSLHQIRPYIWMLQQKSRLIRPATFYNLLLSSFGDPVWIVFSVCCSYLTGAAPGVVFCCWSPSASGFDMLCIQTMYSAYLGRLLSYCSLSIIANQSVNSPLTLTSQDIFIHTTAATGYFLFFRPFSVNSRDGCVWKSQ